MKRQPTEWEKIFVNCISDKKLISEYIKNSYKSIAKSQTILFLKNEQKIRIDTFLKKKYRWPIGM